MKKNLVHSILTFSLFTLLVSSSLILMASTISKEINNTPLLYEKNVNFISTINGASANYHQAESTNKIERKNLLNNTDNCCAFGLHFVNKYQDGRIKSIRVSSLCETTICCSDIDEEWVQFNQYPYVIWRPADHSPVPAGNAIDNYFLIYLSDTNVNSIQVEWIDQGDNVVARHIIEIPCIRIYDPEKEDWTVYTKTTELDDENLFVFAVREEDEDEYIEDCFVENNSKSSCSITEVKKECTTSSGSSPHTYKIQLESSNTASLYKWEVTNVGGTPGVNPSIQNSTAKSAYLIAAPGAYRVDLTTVTDIDTCRTEKEIRLELYKPDFNYSYLDCIELSENQIAGIEITATGIDGLQDLHWELGPNSDMEHGNPIQVFFTEEVTDYPVLLKARDIIGCEYEKKKNIQISLDPKPKFELDYYYFCPEDCKGLETIEIRVVFKNLSTGGYCPIEYTWDFGDGTEPILSNSKDSIDHVFKNVSCALDGYGLPTGAKYLVKLTMKDSKGNLNSFSQWVDIVPCDIVVYTTICPDGKVIYTSSEKGKWELPNATKAPWPYSGLGFWWGWEVDKAVVAYNQDGTYQWSLDGNCGQYNRCILKGEVEIKLECCSKNAGWNKRHTFTADGDDFRGIKRFRQNQYNFFLLGVPYFEHNIIAVTRLMKKRSLLGITYYSGDKAEEITVKIAGNIWRRNTFCNCMEETLVDISDDKTNSKRARAKYNPGFYERFRSKEGSIESTHRVKVNGHVEQLGILKLGKEGDCEPFRWYTDWY